MTLNAELPPFDLCCIHCTKFEREHAGTKCLYAPGHFEAHTCNVCNTPFNYYGGSSSPRWVAELIRRPAHAGCLETPYDELVK